MKPKAKSRKAHLQSFGMVMPTPNEKRDFARSQLNGLEIKRLLQALDRYVLRRHTKPPFKVLQAIETLRKYLETTAGVEFVVTADMPIGPFLAVFEPDPRYAEFQSDTTGA